MKPKFTFLYIAFIISLALVVTLSFLFYKKLNSHIRYTRQFEKSYTIILELRKLEEKMMELDNYCTGFLILADSSFLPHFYTAADSAKASVARLENAIEKNTDQMRRFHLMKSSVDAQINIYSRNIERGESSDEVSMKQSVRRGKMLMDAFRTEARQIEKAELAERDSLYKTKEMFEDFYPNFFNTISIWAGIITLASFYLINREVRMRSKYQTELEKKLQELNRSNSELKQFAYIASHDLQEPLRKIRTFTDKLVFKYKSRMEDETGVIVGRIEASAQRMQELIQDMINFTSLVSREDKMDLVDLNGVIQEVLKEFIDLTQERHAIITWDKLPTVKGNPGQLFLLFKSLFDNAFKFAKPEESPQIRIHYATVDGGQEEDPNLKGRFYHKIEMRDKGIGFSNEFAEKIFMIFQRLHTQQSGYRGKGIGLAIAQRIMTNHNGFIMARGRLNEGAVFIMYFPLQ